MTEEKRALLAFRILASEAYRDKLFPGRRYETVYALLEEQGHELDVYLGPNPNDGHLYRMLEAIHEHNRFQMLMARMRVLPSINREYFRLERLLHLSRPSEEAAFASYRRALSELSGVLYLVSDADALHYAWTGPAPYFFCIQERVEETVEKYGRLWTRYCERRYWDVRFLRGWFEHRLAADGWHYDACFSYLLDDFQAHLVRLYSAVGRRVREYLYAPGRPGYVRARMEYENRPVSIRELRRAAVRAVYYAPFRELERLVSFLPSSNGRSGEN